MPHLLMVFYDHVPGGLSQRIVEGEKEKERNCKSVCVCASVPLISWNIKQAGAGVDCRQSDFPCDKYRWRSDMSIAIARN